jgi:hypothetical protein
MTKSNCQQAETPAQQRIPPPAAAAGKAPLSDAVTTLAPGVTHPPRVGTSDSGVVEPLAPGRRPGDPREIALWQGKRT